MKILTYPSQTEKGYFSLRYIGCILFNKTGNMFFSVKRERNRILVA